jgi:xanthine dehydrogenase accessory factor
MTPEILEKIVESRGLRKAVALVTELESGRQRVIARDHAADDTLAQILDEAFRTGESSVHKLPEGEFFVHVYNPRLRIVIVGAVHIAQALIPIARAAGYDVVVIDPRGAFATADRFPDIRLYSEWPDEIISKIGLDAQTALLALTHDPKIDDPALSAALKSKVFYVGALGSKRTQAKRSERLKASGFNDEQIARIRGPIGLDIGAKGPVEIAVAIMAEITRVLRLGS